MSNEGEARDFLEETSEEKLKLTLLNPTTHFNIVLGPRRRPSPLGEGDRDQQWSNLDGVAISPSFFPFLFLSFFFWLPDRTDPSHRHHPYHFLLSVSLLTLPIWFCMVEICWRRWVTQVSIDLSPFCRHEFAIPVGAETIDDSGCSVDIGFGDFFQSVLLSTLLLWLIL